MRFLQALPSGSVHFPSNRIPVRPDAEGGPCRRGARRTPGIRRRAPFRRAIPTLLLATACAGPQSALDTAGPAAETLASLWWWMAGGALLIWVLVVGLAVWAVRVDPEAHDERKARLLILGGGAVFPAVVLTGLLTYGLVLMPDLLEPGPEGGLRVEVTGEQWWWRVRYHPPDRQGHPEGPVVSANEIRLPVGERVEFTLDSPDVIHSLWIPALGGKMDMIPGRVNRLALEADRTGTFRGTCAEYCGASHALMSFQVVVMEPEAFRVWLNGQAAPAVEPEGPTAGRGEEAFRALGCGACHTVRGTPAEGQVGPDLTHVGSRLTLGAGILPNDPEGFYRWIGWTDEVKPRVHMPAFRMLPEEELRALASYLDGLR